jgi:IS30 family transposase
MHTCTSPRCQQRTLLERYQIMAFLQTRRSQTEIADTLNQSKNILSREIRHNFLKKNRISAILRSQQSPDENLSGRSQNKALKHCRL